MRLILILILILFPLNFLLAKNQCIGLFDVIRSEPFSSDRLHAAILELKNLAQERYSQDPSASLIAKNLFDKKLAELSKYLPIEEIFDRINGTSQSRETRPKIHTKSVKRNKSRADKIIDLSELEAFLKKHGFKSIDETDSEGNYPLHIAARLNDEKAVRMLVRNGARLDAINTIDGSHALIAAAIVDSHLALKALLELGVDVNAQDKEGLTALIHIAQNENLNALKILLEYNPELDKGDLDGKTPLMYAAEADSVISIKVLINNGASKDLVDKEGKTALMFAAENNNTMSLNALLETKAEKEIKDQEGKTALIWAVENGSEAALKILIKNGADVNTKNRYGETPITIAKEYEQDHLVKILKKAGGKK